MRAGLYNELITVYAPELSVNEYGEKVQRYEPLFTCKANVLYNSGSRYVSNDEVLNFYSKTFTVRYYHHFTEKMLIEWQSKKWRIISIDKNRSTQEQIISTELYNE